VFLPHYLVLRYYATGDALRHPVLFFRSFGDKLSARVFAGIVMPATRNQVAIRALVHSLQPGSELERNVGALERSCLEVVSDLDWRKWVEDALQSASLVVIDLAQSSGSVKWELDAAISMVGASRVLALVETEPHEQRPGVRYLRFADDAKAQKSARNELSSWVATSLEELLAT
jgi:hypothetical protein